MKQKEHIKNIVFTALFAAMITVLTGFVGHINTQTGYIHFGDGLIFLAACFLPKGYGIAAAAIGGGLADLLSGWAQWIIPTVIIKGLMALPFSNKSTKILTVRNLIAMGIAVVINTVGYFFAGALFAGNFTTPIADIPGSLVQDAGSIVVFLVIGFALEKAGLKKQFATS